jgi:uncharacterized protein HemX
VTDGWAPAPTVPSPTRRWPSRRPLTGAVLGIVALLLGIAIAVLGQGSASNASDSLDQARQQLSAEQVATRAAQRCAQDVGATLPPHVAAGQALLGTAAQLVAGDAQLIGATHDQQRAGIAGNQGDYNNAVNRANAAVTAANPLIATSNQQVSAFQMGTPAPPASCS